MPPPANNGESNSTSSSNPYRRSGGGHGFKKFDSLDSLGRLERTSVRRQLEPEQDEISNPSSSFDSKSSSHYFGMSLRPGCVRGSRSSSDCGQDQSLQSDCDPSLSLLTDCDQGQNLLVDCSHTLDICLDYGQSLSLNWSSSAKQTTAELDDTDSVVAAERMRVSRQLEHFTVGWLAETPNPILLSDAKSDVQQNLCSDTKAGADQGVMKFNLTDVAFGSDTTYVTARTAVSFTSFDFCPNYWDLRGSKPRKILRTGPGSVFDQLTEQQSPATMKGVHPISNLFEAAASHTAALPQHIKLFQSCATELHETDHVKLPRSDFPARNFASLFSTQSGSRSVPDSPRNSGGDEYGLGTLFSRTSADDESGSDPFSSQSFAGDKSEAGISAQQSLIDDKIASNLLLGGLSGCSFQSKLPGNKVLGKLERELLISPGLEHVGICRTDLTGSQWFQIRNSTASQLVSPPTTFSGNFTVDASQFSDRVGHRESTSTSSKATRFKGFSCGVCSQEFKFKIFGYFRKHLESHNKRREYRCNWFLCGITVDNRHMLERHYLEHLLEQNLHRCAECGRIFDSAPLLNAHINAVHLAKKGQFCLRKSEAFYIFHSLLTTIIICGRNRRKSGTSFQKNICYSSTY
ncbi:unnamed protein product [Gongylonema pulchrum]|uniref:C2H2-type domain-containing protein n=1 Tax=Gongylonema pulchrum TaxID=637853 RepID=A0A183CX77_9BILA|nr:unnamed protein product [Gongylonema pulchrum]